MLVGYAATMESIQRFELALKHLVIARRGVPESLGFDEAWRRAEQLLTRPIGGLNVREFDVATIRRLRELRNAMAHEVLLRWRLERNVGLCTDRDVAEALIEIDGEFAAWTTQLDALTASEMQRLGIGPADEAMAASELRAILQGRRAD